MAKKNSKTKLLIIILMTISITFFATNYIQINNGDRVIIPSAKYEYLINIEKKYEKTENLKDTILEEFLYDANEEQLYDGSLHGMLNELGDPYSEYMSVDEFNSLIEHTQGEYSGIGIYVSVSEDNRILIISPIEDTPGEKAGLKTGDKIIKINGKEFLGDELSEAVKIMKGKPGTGVDITVLREKDNNSEIIDMNIIRENIKIETVKSRMMDNKIGYIRITTFDEQTDADFSKALTKLKQENMKGVIIDLRYNPGGLISSVTNIADKLLGETVITYTQTKSGKKEYYTSDKENVNIPIIVMINEGSASASEILAGAVKDTKSGILLGTKTFGKGIVQRIFPLDDGSGMKLTVSEYFTPNGINIHGIGIEPDVEIKIPEDALFGPDNLSEDIQLSTAMEIMKTKIK